MDTDGRWTIKRGRRRSRDDGELQARVAAEIAVPVFGYENHLGIDRCHGFIRSFTVTDAVTHEAASSGSSSIPDNTPIGVWADTAYRSPANVALLARRGLVLQFQGPKPRGKPLPLHLACGNATRARAWAAFEQVFAAQKFRFWLGRPFDRLGPRHRRAAPCNPGANMLRLAWFEIRLGSA
jgi:hypothetical protein